MAITPEEIARRTQEMLQKHRQMAEGTAPSAAQPAAAVLQTQNLPEIKNGEFLIEVDLLGGDGAIFCVRELYWTEGLEIESLSFRESDKGNVWFAGEYDRRETLKKAIVWVADKHSGQVARNDAFGSILSQLSQGIVEALWPRYQTIVSLNAEEAQALYSSAQKYFKGEAQAGHPIKPIIVEVDYMLKGIISLSRDEFRKLTMSDLERIQLVLSARADVLGLTSGKGQAGGDNASPNSISQDLLGTLPPHVRSRLRT